eukprot:NODE_2453_length_2209_cov_15.945725.p1 GENE.NODE_2453_length_2209_cov_15.945725~~NODE_2453_length_2209_cov_15.945725.p1  ORF type:complete len:420 (-),score=82.09 NODE_2453_length_2209_cov_15.945725:260-1519(-)
MGMEGDVTPLRQHFSKRQLTSQLGLGRYSICLRRFVHSAYFERVCASVVMLNVIFVGVELESSMRAGESGAFDWANFSHLVFTIFYTLELMAHFMVEGRCFISFSNEHYEWNLFDLLLVSGAIIAELLTRVTLLSKMGLALLSIFRFVKLFRIVRMMRLARFFTELRLMLGMIRGTLRSLVWCLILIALAVFMVALCLMQLLLESLPEIDEMQRAFVEEEFGTIMKSMYTLLAAVIGGQDWRDVSDVLFNIGPGLGLIFVFYAMIVTLCLLNIITGLYVEQAMGIMRVDVDYTDTQEAEGLRRTLIQLADAFSDPSDTYVEEPHVPSTIVSAEQFLARVSDKKVQAQLQKLGIAVDPSNARWLFMLLDCDCDGMIELEELITACRNLSGNAQQLTLTRTEQRLQQVQQVLADLHAAFLA